VIKIFEFGSQRGFSTTSGRTYPTDVVMLTIEALYRQVNKFDQVEIFFYWKYLEYKTIVSKSEGIDIESNGTRCRC
jgi:hypothetical protein